MEVWNPPVERNWQLGALFKCDDNTMAAESLEAFCEGVVRMNMVYLERYPKTPCCLGLAGVKYRLPPGCEHSVYGGPCQNVLTTGEILQVGLATCIDIANHTTAYLRMRGVPASTVVDQMVTRQNYPISGMFHILTRTPEGIIDYTQDLIDGDTLRCFQDCEIPMRRDRRSYAGELHG